MASSALRFPDAPVLERPGTPYVMRGIELATSFVTGTDATLPPLQPRSVTAAELPSVLDRVLVGSLQRPPCLVAFSGGRDSAGLLAVATRAARRHGLALPIPATYRFPGVGDVDENAWQDLVVRHLGLTDWLRLDVTDELDLVGPVAAPLLRRFGPVWPPNSHFGGLLVPHARGGTFVTGVGGDELLSAGGHYAAQVLSLLRRPRLSDIRAVTAAVAPRPVRVWRARRRVEPLPWLTPPARDAYARERARDAQQPLWWGRGVAENWWRARYRLGMRASIAAACGSDVTVEHPLMDPDFLSAAAGALWRTGFPTRASAMDLLFGDALPRVVRHRRDKAAFFAPFVNRHSRAFIEAWDGTGVDESLVDVEALRASWAEDRVDARSYALLQSAWLAVGDSAWRAQDSLRI